MALCEKGDKTFFCSQLVTYISQGENEKAQLFLEGVENLCNLRNSSGQTLLHIAARYGNAVMTKYFIDMGFEVDARNKFNVTPLALAVQYRQVDTIAILLEANADIYNSEHRECVLQTVHNFYTARREPVKTYQTIFKMFSDIVCAEYKKDKKALGIKLFDAKCSLHLAVTILRSPRLTKYYIGKGYDVNTHEPYNKCTALHAAVEGTDFPVVKVLVENGADVNAFDSFKRTPLFYYNCHSKESNIKIQMLKYLLDHGASLTLANSSNSTQLEYLLSHAGVKTLDTVLQRDIDLTAKCFRLGKTPLHFLAKNSSEGIIALLQGKTIDVDSRDENGDTALMNAVQRNKNLDLVQFLLDNGADINAENNNGRTPLYHTISCTLIGEKLRKAPVEIRKLLLRRGANIQHVFKTFKRKKVINEQTTLFDLIVKVKQFEISKLFLAQLVLNNELGEPIKDLIRTKIESDEILNEQFNVCKEQIEKMKVTSINESLTLFDLMTVKEEDLMAHAIDFEFVSKLDELTNNISQENSYYIDFINKRVESIVKKLKLTKEFKAVITQSTCCIS